MAQYRIVCTNQEPIGVPHSHAHIVRVGTGTDPEAADQRWTLDEVLRAMDEGNIFYTQGTSSGKIALVEKYICARCQRWYIRSKPDAVSDNNLDNLRTCRWKS